MDERIILEETNCGDDAVVTAEKDVSIKEKDVSIKGVIEEAFEYEYSSGSKDYYKGIVSVLRDSGVRDLVPVIAESSMFDCNNEAGYEIVVYGNIRTRNYYDESRNKRRLAVFVFASELTIGEYIGIEREIPETGNEDVNEFVFSGFICKEPILRVTPRGKHIADVSIAVNREKGSRSDYLPCIFWGVLALEVSELNIGDEVVCSARFQSREYTKRYDDGTEEDMVAYEISVNSVDVTGVSNTADNEISA